MIFRHWEWDISALFRTFLCIMAGWLFVVVHLVILLLAHAASVSIHVGNDLNTALTPLHTAIMADDWMTAYGLMRDNVFAELPFYTVFEKLFLKRNELYLQDLLYDAVKASLSGCISYLLCRFNLLIFTKDHPVLFSATTSIWNSIGIFGGMLLVNLFCTFSFPVNNIMCIGSLLCSLFLVSILSFFRLRDIMKFSRIFLENIKILLTGILDSFYYFLVNCFIFDVLKYHITDPISLIFTILTCAGISNLIYAYIKYSFLT